MYDVITIGDPAADTFVYLKEARLDCSLDKRNCMLALKYGDKIPVDAMEEEIGGNAANVAVGLSKLRLTTALIGAVGDDENGRKIKRILKRRKVATTWLRCVPHTQTNTSVILTYKGERTILTYHPRRMSPNSAVPQSRFVYLTASQNDTLCEKVRKMAEHGNIDLAFNPGSHQLRRGKKYLAPLLKVTHVLFVNKEEAETVLKIKCSTGNRHIKKLLTSLSRMGPRTVIITNGPQGAYGYNGNKYYYIPHFPAKKIEPTGAGDAFSSGFLGSYVSRESLDVALQWGTVNAAHVLTRIGSQIGLLSKSAIMAILKKHKRFKAEII